MKEKLLGKNIAELQEVVLSLGLPKFTAGQIAQWMYQKKVRSIDEMTNLQRPRVQGFPNAMTSGSWSR